MLNSDTPVSTIRISNERGACKGGDIIFVPGKGGGGKTDLDGSVVFRLANGDEMMRFRPDGQVIVRGEIVDSNHAVYVAFREWLGISRAVAVQGK